MEEYIFHTKHLQNLYIQHNYESDMLHILLGHLNHSQEGRYKLFHLYWKHKALNRLSMFKKTYYIFCTVLSYKEDNHLLGWGHNRIYINIHLNVHLKYNSEGMSNNFYPLSLNKMHSS